MNKPSTLEDIAATSTVQLESSPAEATDPKYQGRIWAMGKILNQLGLTVVDLDTLWKIHNLSKDYERVRVVRNFVYDRTNNTIQMAVELKQGFENELKLRYYLNNSGIMKNKGQITPTERGYNLKLDNITITFKNPDLESRRDR